METQVRCGEDSASFIEDKGKPNRKLYLCSIILGFAALQPGNAIITCMQYFIEVYNTTAYKPQFTFPMMIFLPLMGCQIFLIAFGNKFSVYSKLLTSMAALTFFICMVFVISRTMRDKKSSFALAIIYLFLAGIFNGVLQSTLGGLVGIMNCKGKYMKANIIGNGASGITSNVLNLMCLSAVGHAKQELANVTTMFFVILAVIMAGCFFVACIALRDSYVARLIRETPREKSIGKLCKLVWPAFKGQGKNVFLTFFFTFSIFPGVVIAKPLQFLPVQYAVPSMILLFNAFDTLGRLFSACLQSTSPKTILCMTLLRALTVLSTCIIGYEIFNGYFVKDWWILTNIVVIAFTNGVGVNLAMSHSIQEARDEDKESTGKAMTICLTGGIFVGTVVAQLVFANLF
eukprot:TRINITY_DN13106_c0_g1_i1.p1 TRINITY_DN13106_c0_g1~~TRINITY_DN13106_c0_g1_i1.p1  ORF type:complete len:402 (+),score=41.84 TRINITY_DN13106_c0_g1_i1:96-1301(+)